MVVKHIHKVEGIRLTEDCWLKLYTIKSESQTRPPTSTRHRFAENVFSSSPWTRRRNPLDWMNKHRVPDMPILNEQLMNIPDVVNPTESSGWALMRRHALSRAQMIRCGWGGIFLMWITLVKALTDATPAPTLHSSRRRCGRLLTLPCVSRTTLTRRHPLGQTHWL